MKYSGFSYLLGFSAAFTYGVLARFEYYVLALLVVVIFGLFHSYLIDKETNS